MQLNIFGISLFEASVSAPGSINFKPPILPGWLATTAKILIDHFSPSQDTGVLHFSLRVQNSKKTLKLAIDFDIAVTNQGAYWLPTANAAATGTQILQVTPGVSHDPFELRFGLLNLPAVTGIHPRVIFLTDSSGEVYASPSIPLDVLAPEQLGVFRLVLGSGARIYPRLDVVPRLQLLAASLSITPVLRDTSLATATATIELAAHPSSGDLELPLVVPTTASTLDITFDAPPSTITPNGQNFMLPLGAFMQAKSRTVWLAPVAISDYVLKTRWKSRARTLLSVVAGPGSSGIYGITFTQCLDDSVEPLHLIADEDLPLSAQIRSKKGGILAKLGLTDVPVTLYRLEHPRDSHFQLPVPGLSFTLAGTYSTTVFANLRSFNTTKVPVHSFSRLDASFVSGESLYILAAHPGSLLGFLIDPGSPFHNCGSVDQHDILKSYSIVDLMSTHTTLLPVCGLDLEYVANPNIRTAAIKALDMELAAFVIGDSVGSPLQNDPWLYPDNVQIRWQLSSSLPNSDIAIQSLYSGLLTGIAPALRLQPHQRRQANSVIETITEQMVYSLQSVEPKDEYLVRNLAEFDWLWGNPVVTSLETSNVITLDQRPSHWFSASRPNATELPFALVRTSPRSQRLGKWLAEQLGNNPKYNELYAELNDSSAFPSYWTGIVLLEVEAKLNTDSVIGAAMGSSITFRYVGISHSFDPAGPVNLKVTKAYAHPPEVPAGIPVPPNDPRIAAVYSVQSRSIRINNHTIVSLTLRAKVYVYSFLGLTIKDTETNAPLKLDIVGQHDALRGELIVSSSVPITGIKADLDFGLTTEYWPLEQLRLTRLSVRMSRTSLVTALQLVLDGELDVRSSFAKLIHRKPGETLVFSNIQLVSLSTSEAQTLSQSIPAGFQPTNTVQGQFDEPLKFVYMAAKWALDSASFSLGTRWGTLSFNGLNYSLESCIAQDYPGTLPLANQTPNWAAIGYLALRFKLELDVAGGNLSALPGADLQLLLTWPLDVNKKPILDQPTVGLRFSGLNSFILPLFPGLELIARSFTMDPIDVPGSSETVPWFALRDLSLHSNWGDIFEGSSLSAGMFLRSDSRSGYAVIWRNTRQTDTFLQPRWLLIAQNMSLPLGYRWAQEILAPKEVGDTTAQDVMTKKLDAVLSSGTYEEALQPIPDTDHFISRWLVAGGFTTRNGLLNAKFFHQDGAFTGITFDGPIIKALMGGRAVTLAYERGLTPDEDRYEMVIDLPSLSVAGFEAQGGQFRLRLSPSGDFLLDGAYPFPDAKGFRNWAKATSLSIMGFKAQGGFYVARYRGTDPTFKTSAGVDVARMAFGAAAAWGRNLTTDKGWFKAEFFIGFFGLFEGTLVSINGSLNIERLAGAGGVMLTAKATVSLWIITARVTLQAYAELRVEYFASPQILQLAGSNLPRLIEASRQVQATGNAYMVVSATFALQVQFEVEIDLYFASYSVSVSATYVLPVSETIGL